MYRIFLVLLATAGSMVAPALSAQAPISADPGSAIRTRAELESLLDSYEDALASPAYSEAAKTRIRRQTLTIRDRLENGDFHVGDRIAIAVQGETTLPDTVTVQNGPMIQLPLFGEIPLHGVLRAEVEDHLTKELSRYIRNPVVQAEGLLRVSIQGGVGRPGFYVVPADILLTEALMLAGGPGSSDLSGMRIERGVDRLMEGSDVQEALRMGRTLDQLNLQAGDQIYVPQGVTGGSWGRITAVAGILGSLSFLILRFTRN